MSREYNLPVWNDENRFNQSGYSASTIFPKRENYKNEAFFLEDLKKAELREELHQEFLMELKEEHRPCRYNDDGEWECDEDRDEGDLW